jgi:hypothetical protein
MAWPSLAAEAAHLSGAGQSGYTRARCDHRGHGQRGGAPTNGEPGG